MLWPPLTAGMLASIAIFHFVKPLKLRWLLVGFIAYYAASFVGELANHALYRERFKDYGDNPSQIWALIGTWFLSILIVPTLYVLAKKKKPTSREASASSEKT